jgi:hypothetical protein
LLIIESDRHQAREVNLLMEAISKVSSRESRDADERGAALITMLLVSLLLLTAGGALIMTTSMSAANTVDSAAEIQAYYAAEAGTQSVLNILRGNVAPNPTFASDPVGGIADANKISFRKAVTVSTSNVTDDTATPRLSRWMTYNSTYTDRVTLSNSYTPRNGMAFNAALRDPDNSSVVTFSTSGFFTNHPADNPYTFGSGNPRFTLRYDPQASTTITTSGASTLGRFTVTSAVGTYLTFLNEPFTLTITQTAPWPVTSTINCTLSGVISSTASFITVTFPTLANNLQGVQYTRTATAVLSNAATSIPVTVTAPEPNRLIADVTGFGPRNAKKQLRMLLSRFAFDVTTPSAITIRSADDNSRLTFNAGNSSQYFYDGHDNAGGTDLSAFAVTGSVDKAYIDSLLLPASQIKGTPSGVLKINVSDLPTWLQTADAARAFVIQMREAAQNENRYFYTASQPTTFGTPSNPLLTFVDGDTDLPLSGGAGLLVVTGTLTMNGSTAFDGLILVLGGGALLRDGGGNGDSLGAAMVARFGNSGNFLPPTFSSAGSGTSTIKYDSDWVRKALSSTGPRVTAIGEF